MKVLWTLAKVVIALVILVPISLILLGTAMIALRLALLALVVYVGFKLLARLFRGPAPKSMPREIARIEPVDPYYSAAMRELDQEIGDRVRR